MLWQRLGKNVLNKEIKQALDEYHSEMEGICAVRFELARREIEAWKQLELTLNDGLPKVFQCKLNGTLKNEI